ncbi:hypothetical protein K438DRAFT_963930 [Mycena galopus ATCC 62051]|nr:hypothetical protein K438DRAFT_963930 [Mycena galopus ATCC 62051]
MSLAHATSCRPRMLFRVAPSPPLLHPCHPRTHAHAAYSLGCSTPCRPYPPCRPHPLCRPHPRMLRRLTPSPSLLRPRSHAPAAVPPISSVSQRRVAHTHTAPCRTRATPCRPSPRLAALRTPAHWLVSCARHPPAHSLVSHARHLNTKLARHTRHCCEHASHPNQCARLRPHNISTTPISRASTHRAAHASVSLCSSSFLPAPRHRLHHHQAWRGKHHRRTRGQPASSLRCPLSPPHYAGYAGCAWRAGAESRRCAAFCDVPTPCVEARSGKGTPPPPLSSSIYLAVSAAPHDCITGGAFPRRTTSHRQRGWKRRRLGCSAG